MKIAYVVPYVPNLIRTRSYNLICQLATLGHEVTVFTLGVGSQDQRDVEILKTKVAYVYYQKQPVWHSIWNSLTTIPTRKPLQSVYSWNPKLAKKLTSLLSVQGSFDIVHVEHLRGSLYGQFVKLKQPNFPVIWDSVDCISHLFEQASLYNTGGFGKYITRFELGRTRQMEGMLISKFDNVLVTSETDKKALIGLSSPGERVAPISVLSNGVDLKYFHPDPNVERDEETLVLSGKMSYHANISMAKFLVTEIMPKVWAKRPKVQLVIVGKDPTAEVHAFGVDPRITVTGTVNDIRPFLWKATVAVVPLVYGAGIQNKILEAMACGTPVISTSKTLSSIDAIPGKELLVADGANEFANKILEILDDRNLQTKISSAGERYVQRHHDWRAVAYRLSDCYVELLGITQGNQI